MKRLPAVIYMLFFLFFSCGPHTVKGKLNPIAPAAEDDAALRAIATAARADFSEFTRRLRRPAADEYNFQIKYPFAADEDSGYTREYLWLKDIRFKDGFYYGVIANEPLYSKDRALNDTVSFLPDDIADWMYMKGERIRGGRSIKYLIEKIPAAERDEELQRYLERFD
jgi:uncharacterized protein YegJ (DUF2314 family)